MIPTPEMAGIQALINQQNGGRQGVPNYYYYALANAQNTAECNSSDVTSNACVFQDVTSGSNLICATLACAEDEGVLPDLAGFSAVAGYDMASGLGSPNAANLATQWSSVVFNSSTTTLSLSQTTGIAHGTSITLSGTVASAGSSSATPTGDVAFILSQGSLGTAAAFATLEGGAYTANINSLPAGSYTVTARYAGDSNFASSVSAAVPVTVGQGNVTVTLTPQNLNSSTCDNQDVTSFVYGALMMVEVDVTPTDADAGDTDRHRHHHRQRRHLRNLNA